MNVSTTAARTCFCLALVLASPIFCAEAAAAPTPWRRLPLSGGPVVSIAAAPSDPDVVYASSLGGGLFRSDDGGDTWASPGAAAAARSYGRVTVSPANPLEVALSSSQLPPPHYSRSRDGGATWERVTVGTTAEVGGVFGVVYDPTIPGRLYARTQSGLYRSTDDGRSWRRLALAASQVATLYVDPRNSNRLIALDALGRSALYVSGDAGATWIERISTDLAGGFLTFAVDPVHPATLYLATGAGLLVSEDDGLTWRETAAGAHLTGLTDLATTPNGTLLAASFYGIRTSVDRGATFGPNRAADSIGRLAVAADATVYAAADSGIWRSTTHGATWRRAHQGVTAQYVLGLAASGGRRPALLAAGKGLFLGRAPGEHWMRVPEASGLGPFNPFFPPYRLAYSPVDPRLAFAVFDGGVFRSADGGETWRQIDPLRGFPLGSQEASRFTFAFDPGDPRRIYFFAGFAGPAEMPRLVFSYLSEDGGETWDRRPDTPEITRAAVDPARTFTLVGATAGGLVRSNDRGLHWRPVAPEIEKPTALAFGPGGVLFAGTENAGVWTSRDGGKSFRPLGRGLSGARIAELIADPVGGGRLFASVAGLGVYLWTPGAAVWRKLDFGFPAASFRDGAIALDPTGHGALYAATWGRGVYRLDLGDL